MAGHRLGAQRGGGGFQRIPASSGTEQEHTQGQPRMHPPPPHSPWTDTWRLAPIVTRRRRPHLNQSPLARRPIGGMWAWLPARDPAAGPGAVARACRPRSSGRGRPQDANVHSVARSKRRPASVGRHLRQGPCGRSPGNRCGSAGTRCPLCPDMRQSPGPERRFHVGVHGKDDLRMRH